MLYRKNITRPESLLRVAGGVALIAAGLWWLAASPLGLVLAASGVGSILSGAFGYCPACAMVGRKPVEGAAPHDSNVPAPHRGPAAARRAQR